MNNYSDTTMVLPLGLSKPVAVDFDGGDLTSDAGLILLTLADRKAGITAAVSDSLRDQRQRSKVSHSLQELVQGRVLSIAAGYADANDMDTLRRDPALKVAVGRCPLSEGALASQPTLSRFENSVTKRELLSAGLALAERVIAQLPDNTKSVVLDIDATDDPCHGQQEFEGFNAYYDSHCYMPLLMHLTDEQGQQWPLAALLRPGQTNPLAGVVGLLSRAVATLRARWPGVEILVRGDSGFGSDKVLRCCDRLGVRFLLGLPTNSRVKTLGLPTQLRCQAAYDAAQAKAAKAKTKAAKAKTKATEAATGRASAGDGDHRRYGRFLYKAGSWPWRRDTVIKVAMTQGKLNPRYVVTNLKRWRGKALNAESIYELYCGRGDQENRIKELKLDLESGRTSCHRFLANQMRLLQHLAAHILWTVVRAAAAGTRWTQARVATLQLQVLKVAARVRESTRRVWLHLCTAYPYQDDWRLLLHRLTPCTQAPPS
jgi:hypothetical protein